MSVFIIIPSEHMNIYFIFTSCSRTVGKEVIFYGIRSFRYKTPLF